jgi:hypothetical protein
MNTKVTIKQAFYALAVAGLFFTACQKQDSFNSLPSTTSAIVVQASGTSQDSVYLVGGCHRGEKRDSIAQSALPSPVNTYLTTNYSGYTFNRAFVTKDAGGNTSGYIVVVFYNDKPVGLRFDASGNFVSVLEQREKGDLDGPGFHHGGRFEHRDGMHRDSVALAALPASVLTYMSSNYATDTLAAAFKDRAGNYVILSKNNGAFATVFDANGTFIRRAQLNTRQGSCQSIDPAALPASVTSYLSATYPNYVFEKAFSNRSGGYVVVIDANNTKYAVEFDASGNFLRAKTVF